VFTLKAIESRKRIAIAWVFMGLCIAFAGIGAFTSQGIAQSDSPFKMRGIIDDFTPDLDGNGRYQVSGEWTLELLGNSGRGNFSFGVNMVRAENPNTSAHTHYVVLKDATVTEIAGGFRLSGPAVLTGNNGNLAGFSGSTVNVDITGGNTITYTNIALTFEGGAVGHFGALPLHGVVSPR